MNQPKRAKILVVDDDTVVLKAVTQILQREGYPVVAIDDAVFTMEPPPRSAIAGIA